MPLRRRPGWRRLGGSSGARRRRRIRAATASAPGVVRRGHVHVHAGGGLGQFHHQHHSNALRAQEFHGRHQPAVGSSAAARVFHAPRPRVLVEKRRRLDTDPAKRVDVAGHVGHHDRDELRDADRSQGVERLVGVLFHRRVRQFVERFFDAADPQPFHVDPEGCLAADLFRYIQARHRLAKQMEFFWTL